MNSPFFPDLQSFLVELRKRGELIEVKAEVSPRLELAEIHRRVIAEQGSALLFSNVSGSPYPVATNLFGTKARVDLAFGSAAQHFIKEAANLPAELFPFSASRLWQKKGMLRQGLSLGTKRSSSNSFSLQDPPELNSLPALTTWSEDGGPFLTLPLVYTEHPETGVHNLGMYRMQVFSNCTTGMHMQIGKGGGFHLAAAMELGRALPVNVFLGGPPAAILSSIMPLPENVPELMMASLILGKKIRLASHKLSSLPVLADAEFVLLGSVHPEETHPEGPFGDHYGYYSLEHDFPLFRCKALLHKKNAVFPATVVGKPRQEDFFIGDHLQELLSPLFPLVMPTVKDIWSYGETGYHSLAAAVVNNRYKREAMVSSFRILGEGQLSLTKFLILLDKQQLDLKDFRSVLQYALERADFRTDLYVFSHLSMDTLDYTGPALNEGSKGVLLGMGDPLRKLAGEYKGTPPSNISKIKVFCPGCLVVSSDRFLTEDELSSITEHESFSDWPLIVLCDDAEQTAKSTESFLWSTFTRFEPAADIYAKSTRLNRFHPSLTPPVLIDSRLKENFPKELLCDPDTEKLVDRRWGEYFGK